MYTVEWLDRFRKELCDVQFTHYSKIEDDGPETEIEKRMGALLWAIDEERRRLLLIEKLKRRK